MWAVDLYDARVNRSRFSLGHFLARVSSLVLVAADPGLYSMQRHIQFRKRTDSPAILAAAGNRNLCSVCHSRKRLFSCVASDQPLQMKFCLSAIMYPTCQPWYFSYFFFPPVTFYIMTLQWTKHFSRLPLPFGVVIHCFGRQECNANLPNSWHFGASMNIAQLFPSDVKVT